MEVLATDTPFWLVDPLDGTRNFVAGDPNFGTMVAFVMDGHARAAWIHLSVTGRTFVAEEGAGAFVEGARLRSKISGDMPTGTVYSDFMPPELRAEILPRARERTRLVDGPMAAAIEYTSLALGDKDYVVYHRLYPWDHVPGALLVSEAASRYSIGTMMKKPRSGPTTGAGITAFSTGSRFGER